MSIKRVKEEAKRLKGEGFKLIFTTEDEAEYYFASPDNERLLLLSADLIAAEAFATLASDNPDNNFLPNIYDHYKKNGLYYTLTERLLCLNELEGGPEGQWGRIARNFTNFLAGHDPARGTENNHDHVYEGFRKYEDLNEVGQEIATLLQQSYEDAPDASETLVYDRSRQHIFLREREEGAQYDFVFMQPFVALSRHIYGFSERFNEPASGESILHALPKNDGQQEASANRTRPGKNHPAA